MPGEIGSINSTVPDGFGMFVILTQFVRSSERQIVKLPPGSLVSTSFSWTPSRSVAVVNRNGAPQQVAAELLGDRVNVQNLVVKDGQIALNMLGFAPGDSMCCPSQSAIRAYRLQGDKLQVVSEVKPTAAP